MNASDTIYIDLFFDQAEKRPQVLQYFMERPYGTLHLLKDACRKDACRKDANNRTAMRSAWVISHLGEYHPHFLQSYYNELIDAYLDTEDSSVLRSLGKAINHLKIKPYRIGEVFDFCVKESTNFNQAIATRVHCMYLLNNIQLLHPELKNEVMEIAELLFETANEPSMRGALKKILKKNKR